MRATTTILATLISAGPALAHPGHVAEAAGHSHFLAAGSLALAALITAICLIRYRKRPERRA